MDIEQALIEFIKAVLNKKVGQEERNRVVLEIKDFNPLHEESELALAFGYEYSDRNKIVLWSSNKNVLPSVLTVEQGVRQFLTHYGLI